MNDILINLGISALLVVLKDRRETSKWRRAMLKVFRAIAQAFSEDEEFVSVAKSVTK